jgi:hypothetical protein
VPPFRICLSTKTRAVPAKSASPTSPIILDEDAHDSNMGCDVRARRHTPTAMLSIDLGEFIIGRRVIDVIIT